MLLLLKWSFAVNVLFGEVARMLFQAKATLRAKLCSSVKLPVSRKTSKEGLLWALLENPLKHCCPEYVCQEIMCSSATLSNVDRQEIVSLVQLKFKRAHRT
jgi:hypothetical protein